MEKLMDRTPFLTPLPPDTRPTIDCVAATSVLAAAVASLVKHRYGRANPDLREDDTAWRRDLDTLRHAELSHLSSLVKNGPPKRGKG